MKMQMEVVVRKGRRRRRRRSEGARRRGGDAEPFLSGWVRKGQDETMWLQGKVCECVHGSVCMCVYELEYRRNITIESSWGYSNNQSKLSAGFPSELHFQHSCMLCALKCRVLMLQVYFPVFSTHSFSVCTVVPTFVKHSWWRLYC